MSQTASSGPLSSSASTPLQEEVQPFSSAGLSHCQRGGLLVGLTGSGKTTYAKRRLESSGAVWLSVDELVHGRYGVDYPERHYFALEAPVVAEVRECLAELVAAGRDVVPDHGLWVRSTRKEWKLSAGTT
ncbi:AAA family ATPase [Streptomyces sp. NPDC059862]|uniref:AAA family ATPase n=1 Tax=Streptomyces sp. NPDC059862 TaxID=3346975 RepID=UPI00365D0D34